MDKVSVGGEVQDIQFSRTESSVLGIATSSGVGALENLLSRLGYRELEDKWSGQDRVGGFRLWNFILMRGIWSL
jgi:hypothetical protein